MNDTDLTQNLIVSKLLFTVFCLMVGKMLGGI